MSFTIRSRICNRPRSLTRSSPFKIFPFPFCDIASFLRQIWSVSPGRLSPTWVYCCYSPWQILFATICLLPCSLATLLRSLCVCFMCFRWLFFPPRPAPCVWFITCYLLTGFFFFLPYLRDLEIFVLWIFNVKKYQFKDSFLTKKKKKNVHNIKCFLSVTHRSNQHTLEKIRLLTRLIERVFSQLIDESFDPSNVRKYRRNHNFSVCWPALQNPFLTEKLIKLWSIFKTVTKVFVLLIN